MKWQIYALTDPRDNEVRYVGFTTKPLSERLRRHVNDTGQKKWYVSNWLRQLKALNLRPTVSALEAGEGSDTWQAAEAKWIAEFRRQGARLTNATTGGEGCPGAKRSPEYVEKLRQRMLGNPYAKLGIAASIAYHTGRTTPPEVRLKMSESHKGIRHEHDHRVKQREANKVKKLSENDIREIRKLKGSASQEVLAVKFGVSRSAISRVHRGKLGAVVPDLPVMATP
jgi:DNA-binding XRE family transcriptional regulator